MEIELNQNLEYAIRRDLTQVQSRERNRWQYKRGSWRPSINRKINLIEPGVSYPGPSPSTGLSSSPGQAKGSGLLVYLKAFINTQEGDTACIVMSDWHSMSAYIAHITFMSDIMNTETDGIRLFVTDSQSVPQTPPPPGAKELIFTSSSTDYEYPYQKSLMSVPGSPGGAHIISTPCCIFIPFKRWRLCAYYHLDEVQYLNHYSSHIIFDVREIVDSEVGGGIDAMPYSPPVIFTEPISQAPQPEQSVE